MKPRIMALLCLLVLLPVFAVAADGTLTMNPPSATLPPGATQIFNASFTDGSHIVQCTWNATGAPPNAVTPIGANGASAVFAAGTVPGQYVLTSVCANNHGITAVGNAPITITPQ